MSAKNRPLEFGARAVVRTPAEIANDPTLSNARKIELLKSIKDHNPGPENEGAVRDADLELDKLLRLDTPTGNH